MSTIKHQIHYASLEVKKHLWQTIYNSNYTKMFKIITMKNVLWLEFEEKIYTKAIVKVSSEEDSLHIGGKVPPTLPFPLRFP